MTDHAHELRRYARKIAHPAGDVPAVMLAAADEIERLMAKLETAERARDNANAAAAGIALQAEKLQAERDALRARIETMEQQEPVAFGLYSGWVLKATYLKDHEACEQRDRRQLTADLSGSLEAYRVVPLCALPGAQPAPSVPDVDALAQFIREIDGKHQLGAGALAERIVEWLAAAQEAKPCP